MIRMKGTVGAEVSVQQKIGVSKGKSSWPNYWHGVLQTVDRTNLTSRNICEHQKVQATIIIKTNLAIKYNLATIINKLGMNMRTDSIHKVTTTISLGQDPPLATYINRKQAKNRDRSSVKAYSHYTKIKPDSNRFKTELGQ